MIIKEFLPNPIGSDKEGEYILLLHNGAAAVFLDGWKIKDASGKEFFLGGKLEPGQELRLSYAQTKISLNNNGERLQLFDANGDLKDELSYLGQAKEGQIITKRLATSELATSQEGENGYPPNPQITNSQLPFSKNIIFLDVLTAAILAGLALYIFLQLEKKLEQRLF